jgi:hypothetical protein
MKRARRVPALLGIAALSFSCGSASMAAADEVALAVADFDYVDSSGEVRNQSTEHAGRLQDFARLIRDELSASGKYQVVPLDCPQPPCSAGAMDAESLTEAARQSGARLLLYGGIHKMSTLIQFGKAQVVDLTTDQVVFDRTISFRGDNEQAWTRAGQFLAEDLIAENLSARP